MIIWSQSSTTWTVTATGYDDKAVASQSDYRATATGTGAFATQTSTSTSDSTSAGAVVRPGILLVAGIVGVLVL